MNEPTVIMFQVYDDLGVAWVWDGERIWSLDAEEEMLETGEDTSQIGYVAHTVEDAIVQLIEGGYIVGIYRESEE